MKAKKAKLLAFDMASHLVDADAIAEYLSQVLNDGDDDEFAALNKRGCSSKIRPCVNLAGIGSTGVFKTRSAILANTFSTAPIIIG